MIEIRINGISYQAEEGKTILDIARENSIDIPTLCYMEGVSDIGSCRLCAVEVEGFRNLLPACRTKAKDGMVIITASDRLTEYRKEMLKLILTNHNQDCMSCPANGTCELQLMCNRYEVEHAEHDGNRKKIEKKMPVLAGQPLYYIRPQQMHTLPEMYQCMPQYRLQRYSRQQPSGTFHIVDALRREL